MGEDADAPVTLRVTGPELLAPQDDPSGCRLQSTSQHPQKSGLSRAVRSKHGQELTFIQPEADAVHRAKGSEVPREGVHLQPMIQPLRTGIGLGVDVG
jgi:hypothetical protein